MTTVFALTIAGIFAFVAVVLTLELAKANKQNAKLKAELEGKAIEATTKTPKTANRVHASPAKDAPLTTNGDLKLSHGLFATLSHELRTPLNGVMGMAQLIKQDHQDERIDILESCGHQMQSVLHALVNYTKIQANWGELPEYREWVNLHDLLEQIRKDLAARARTRGLKIAIEHESKKLRLRIDRDHLTSIIESAIQGSLECVSPNRTEDGLATLQISWQSVEAGVKIVIENPLEKPTSNRGQKIAEVAALTNGKSEERTKIEYLYWAVASALLEHYHGGMIANPMPDGGMRTTLAMDLEKMESNPSDERPIGGPRLDSFSKGPDTWVKLPFVFRVLVVEDDPINRMLMQELLIRLGQEYRHAENGQQALEILSQDDHFDAILMDIDMPLLNGVSTAQAIRMGEVGEKCVKTPIVAVTAFNSLSDESKFRKAGMNYYIPKPIGAQDLRVVLLDIRQKVGVVNV